MLQDPSKPPERIGRYEIACELGRGMMGVVYEARDPELDRTIALKTIQLAFAVRPEERASFEKRFFAEARIAAGLSHPGIVVVHDVGRDAETGTLFIAFEYLRGRTLDEFTTRETRLDWKTAVRIMQRVAEALQYAHERGVIHRDIKPANIMLLESGAPKVLDFGVAKLESAGRLTATGQFFGTPVYMAPEQALGRKVDGRADLFSLGAVAYALLTGQLAFEADNVVAIIGRVVRHDPALPSTLVPGLPPAVDYCLARAMAKSPADRYPDGRSLAEDLDDILNSRQPRHRSDWKRPARAEGTVASRVDAGAEKPELPRLMRPARAQAEATAMRFDAAPRWRKWLLPASAAIAAVIGVAALVTYMTESRRPSLDITALHTTSPVRTPVAPTDVEPTAVTAAPTVRTPGERPKVTITRVNPKPSLRSTMAPASTATDPSTEKTPDSESEPEPSLLAVSAETAVPPRAARQGTGEGARIDVDFEHPLKSGTFRLWLDDKLVIHEKLEARAKKFVAVTVRKGSIRRTFEVQPGGHEVRVQVTWDENDKTDILWGKLESGETRKLEIRVGQLRKNLSMEWK